MTLVFINNLRLKRGCLFKCENNQFKLVAIRLYSFQTVVAGARHTVISRYFCLFEIKNYFHYLLRKSRSKITFTSLSVNIQHMPGKIKLDFFNTLVLLYMLIISLESEQY